jgi:7-cyano-7-deazaguanine synthase
VKAVVICSGGMDSTTLLHYMKAHLGKENVAALGVDYGQRHSRELLFANEQAKLCDVSFELANLLGIRHLLSGSALTDSGVEVPHGHYEDESMKATVVPNRNMIMLSVAAGAAIARGFDAVAYGAHAGDHTIYPDCRPEFAEAVEKALALCHFTRIELVRPFVKETKGGICRIGDELGVDFSRTWSCYEGGEFHCGKCGTCVERKEAFEEAGVQDPTEYAS